MSHIYNMVWVESTIFWVASEKTCWCWWITNKSALLFDIQICQQKINYHLLSKTFWKWKFPHVAWFSIVASGSDYLYLYEILLLLCTDVTGFVCMTHYLGKKQESEQLLETKNIQSYSYPLIQKECFATILLCFRKILLKIFFHKEL